MSTYLSTIEIKVPSAYELVISKEELIRQVETLAQRFLIERQMQAINAHWKSPAL